jgi:pilus assembly protein CpaB
MRAVSIDARSSSFDGLLRPGDRVDVLFTSNGDNATKTLMQSVLVLSVGGNIARTDEATGASQRSTGTSVTLSVTVEQAQIVTQSTARGKLTLSLRNAEDIALVEESKDASTSQKQAPLGTALATKGPIEHVR